MPGESLHVNYQMRCLMEDAKLDQYLLRDLTGETFKRGDTSATVGWAQNPLKAEHQREEGESVSMPVVMISMLAPAYAGLENLMGCMALPHLQLQMRALMVWTPGAPKLELKIEGRPGPPEEMLVPGAKLLPWKNLISPLEFVPAEQSQREKYERARMYSVHGDMFLLQLIDSFDGRYVVNRFKKSNQKSETKMAWRRVESSGGTCHGLNPVPLS